MSLQALVVAPLVGGCAGYAAWALAPTVLRRALASALLALPLPRALAAGLRRQAVAQSSCACDGCPKAAPAAIDGGADAARPPSEVGVAPIVFHPRLRK